MKIEDLLIVVADDKQRKLVLELFGIQPRQVLVYRETASGKKFQRAIVFPPHPAPPNIRVQNRSWLENILKNRVETNEVLHL